MSNEIENGENSVIELGPNAVRLGEGLANYMRQEANSQREHNLAIANLQADATDTRDRLNFWLRVGILVVVLVPIAALSWFQRFEFLERIITWAVIFIGGYGTGTARSRSSGKNVPN